MVKDVPMKCSELRDRYGLDAIGLAGDAEHREIRAHLDRGCEVCTPAMQRARDAAAVLGIAAQGAGPAPLLRRIVGASGKGSSTFVWIPILGGLLAFAIVACFYFAGRENDTGRELGRVNEIRRTQNIALTRYNDALGIINAADARAAAFGVGQGTAPTGKVFVSPSQGAVLIVSNLPQAVAGKAYEMWVMRESGSPQPAGVFQSAPDGSALNVQRRRMDPGAEAIAVTVEDAAGAAAPSGRPLFSAPIR
jgi:hypothetical protein